MSERSSIGIIVNPLAGKDIRRLTSAAGHSPDVAKVGLVRRVVEAALDAGVHQVVVAPDTNAIGARAIAGLEPSAFLLDTGVTGSRSDTSAAARALRERGVQVVVVIGGDGTCRDVAIGWPAAPMIAISTGTNNVFPRLVDGTSAGWAAGLIATGAIDLVVASTPTKRIALQITDGEDATPVNDTALVEIAILDSTGVGARAVLDAASVRFIIAAVSRADTTGLSSVAGRLMPLDDEADGGVLVQTGAGGRRILVPLTPGRSDTLAIADVRRVDGGEPTVLRGPGVLALDGERDRVLSPKAVVVAWIERSGPVRIDVERTLAAGAAARRFDLAYNTSERR